MLKVTLESMMKITTKIIAYLASIVFLLSNCDEYPVCGNVENITSELSIEWKHLEETLSAPKFNAITFAENNRILTDTYRIDNGNWEKTGREGHDIAVNSKNNIFIVTSTGFVKSEDNGSSFSSYTIQNAVQHIRNIECSGNDELFISFVGMSLKKSSDNGLTWRTLIDDNRNVSARFLKIIDSTIFYGTELGLLLSHDKGVSWDTTLSNSIPLSAAKDWNDNIWITDFFSNAKISNDYFKTWNSYPLNFKQIYSSNIGDVLIGILEDENAFYLTKESQVWKQIELTNDKDVIAVAFNKVGDKILLGTQYNGIIFGQINRK